MAMRIRASGLAVVALLASPHALAQWVHSGGPYYTTVKSFQRQGPNLFAGMFGNGVLLSSDNGTSWEPRNQGLTYTDVRSIVTLGTNLFVGTGGGIYRSVDAGGFWTGIDSGLTNGNVQAFAVIGNSLFAGTGGGVFVTTDSGGFWTSVDSGLGNVNVGALAAIGTDLYAGTNGGVYLSTDFGALWRQTGLHTAINALAVVEAVLFAGTGSWSSGGSVIRTTDKGTTWVDVGSGLSGRAVQAFAVHRSSLFAGSSWVGGGGVSLSTNHGDSWSPVDSGLTDKDVTTVGCGETDLFAGTVVGGIWRRPLSEMVTSAGKPFGGLPVRNSLLQNFPNPFNPTTKIQFTIINRQLTIVNVFDLLGREVARLVNEVKEPGTYTVEFDGSHLASGVYFYRLTAGEFVQTKKLLLVI